MERLKETLRFTPHVVRYTGPTYSDGYRFAEEEGGQGQMDLDDVA